MTDVLTDHEQRTAHTARIARLSTASLKRVIEPDVDVMGEITKAQPVPDELLSIAGLGIELSAEQKATLAREELASILRVGILFETVLMSGFAFQLTLAPDVTDARFVYALHEIGEETRHSRLFIRVVDQLAPTQFDLFGLKAVAKLRSRILPFLLRRPAMLDAGVLVGEEIPDLLQMQMADHPDTDEFVRAVNRYHRLEEARHLAFARTTVGEHYRNATWSDRMAVRWIIPSGIVSMFNMMVQPFVYRTVGLPAFRTWRAVAKSPGRLALRRQAARAVLKALIDSGAFTAGKVPYMWRRICEVDRNGSPLPA